MPPDLFISHSSADAEAARALVTEFEKRGITCWIAPRDIPMGSSYQSEIVSAIERSRAMLLLFSGATNSSEHVLREVELAAQGRKAVYPLRIDAAEPAGGLRYMLANKQWVERQALGTRLVETIEQLLANAGAPREGASTPPPPAQPAKLNRLPIFAGVAALAVVIGAGAFALQGVLWPPKPPSRPELTAAAPPVRELPSPADRPKSAEAPTPPPAATVQAPPAPAAEAPPARAPAPAETPPARADSQPGQGLPPAGPPQSQPPVLEARLPAERAPLPPTDSAQMQISKSAPTRAEAEGGHKKFFRECDICPAMAVVQAGSNMIGSPNHESGRSNNEGPQQPVVFRVPFAVGRSEISFEEYIACINEGECPPGLPADYDWGYGKQPVINVSWNDAKAYVGWLSRKTGGKYRLLSEAEWEYAARGCARVCESLPFWFGIEISKDRVNYDSRYAYLGSPKATARKHPVPIDVSEANPFGLLHVHGNVSEWVEDCWAETLAGLPRDGLSRTEGDCSRRVVRGGSWDDQPKDVRSAKRSWQASGDRRAQIGFRVARELKP